MLSQAARQDIVGLQLQPLSACQIKLLAEGSSKVTETGFEPAILRLQGWRLILSANTPWQFVEDDSFIHVSLKIKKRNIP